jgi:hypothetical protein
MFTPHNFHATIVNVLCLLLVAAPVLALPAPQATPPMQKDPHENKLKTSSGEAVLRTTTPPLSYLPSLDEIKTKANDPERKKLIQPKEKLPVANRCRPGNQVCQDYWQKQGKPSSGMRSAHAPSQQPAGAAFPVQRVRRDGTLAARLEPHRSGYGLAICGWR